MVSEVLIKSAQDAACQLASDQAYNMGFTSNDAYFKSVATNKSIGPQPLSQTPIPQQPSSGTPLVLSPISSISTPSSPVGAIWDTPVTPTRQSANPSYFDNSTPLTPPVTLHELWKIRESQTEPIPSVTLYSKSPKQLATPSPDSDKKDFVYTPTNPVVDKAHFGELFQSCKSTLQAIADERASKYPNRCKFTPSFAFGSMSENQSSDGKTDRREQEDAKPQSKTESANTSSVIACTSKTQTQSQEEYKGLKGTLEHIMPSEIHGRLSDGASFCVASCVKAPDRRCSRRVKQQLPISHKILEAISNCIEQHNYAELPDHLKRLLEVAMCSQHKNVALIQPKARSRIDELRAFIARLPQASGEELSTFRTWTEALASRSSTPHIDAKARESSLTSVPSITGSSTTASGHDIKSDLLGFQAYKSTHMDDLAIAKALKKMVARPLSQPDMKEGFIYIFWDEGNFGFIKIGRTNDLERRLKEWNKCKSTHSYHPSSRDGRLLKVPHVQRVERLIHIELTNIRKKRACDTCKNTRTHTEWFALSEAKAVEVFQKWRGWILQEPYEENDEGKWVIRPEMLNTIPEACKLEPEKVQSLQVRSRSSRNGPKRPGLRRRPAMRASDASKRTDVA